MQINELKDLLYTKIGSHNLEIKYILFNASILKDDYTVESCEIKENSVIIVGVETKKSQRFY